MEESFTARVKKTFGSLSSPSSSSLWSLTDDEIEYQQWTREAEHELDIANEKKRPNSNVFESFPNVGDFDMGSVDYGKLLVKDLEDELDDQTDFGGDQLETKSCIRLDNEEEEDGYGKVAVGKEKAGERLYMKDVNDYESDADYYNPLPISFRDISRDPRANVIAAKVRLKEDAEAAEDLDVEAARKIETLNVLDNDGLSGDGHLKSILKRKDDRSDSKPQKRVRFDTDYIASSGKEAGAGEAKTSLADFYSFVEAKENLIKVSSSDEVDEGLDGIPMESCSTEEGCSAEGDNEVIMESYSSGESSIQNHPYQVPAYLRNPSKYTHYTFDSSSEMDEESNRQGFMDFLNLIKKSKGTDLQPEDDVFDSSKPVTFIPKRKSGGVTVGESETRYKRTLDAGKELAYQKGFPVGIGAIDDVCVLEEENELETDGERKNSARQSGRRYRTKSRMGSDESRS